ncbi:putative ferric-chelate reductase 1 [Panulirus ornatus]|uniref:putative ferric-chelate reductase 1 n=1 Tax=Panulirus ornatus TaxID=150431 RepID=UPI003A857FCE
MCGMRHHAWILCLLTVAQTVRLAASQGFIYSKYSCQDLIPRHPDAVAMAEKREQEINHVQQPAEEGKNTTTEEASTTTTTTTTTTTSPPPPEASMYTGNMQVQVLTSEEGYRRLKTLTVTLQSADYINGFMLQARKEGGNEVVGRFMDVPHRGEYLTCPNGDHEENTVIHEAAPLRLANLTFTWMAPREDQGRIVFMASVLLNAGTQYKVYKSAPLKLNLYPVSTKECAVAKSCFRYCMKQGGSECEAHTSRYMATLEYLAKKTKVKITLGGQMPETNGYLAVAFSQDRHRLSGADISVCYRTEEATVGVEHYLLENMDYSPDLHLGVLSLDSSDVDGDHVWCTFTRPLTGQDNNVIDLGEPHYYFYFWGHRNGSTIFLPTARNMKRSSMMISKDDKLFNEILNSGVGPRHQTPYSIVAAAIIFFIIHFLCW